MAEKNYKKIDITIIIINFNSFDLTSKTLETLIEFSSGFNYEVIIVDNSSIDSSGIKLKKKFPNYIYLFNQENLGFARANNQALEIAKGSYILFLNNDVVFEENTIGSLLLYLEKKNERILIAPKLLNTDGTIQHSIYSFQNLWLSFTTYFFLYKLLPKSKYFNRYYLINKGINKVTEVDGITGAFMLFRKKDILELNGFDEDFFFYGEDNDLCKRFKNMGGKIIYYPKVKITHLKGGTKKTNWFHEKNHTLSTLKLFKKHFPFYKRIIVYVFFIIGIILRVVLNMFAFLLTMNSNYFKEVKLKLKTLTIIMSNKYE